MLNRRTQILFDEDLWKKLLEMAKEEKVSVGEVVRSAVEDRYLKAEEMERRLKTVDSILKHRKKQKGVIDYKALVNEGRKL